jgi:nucleoside-diphosphate-sugar epimerase
VVSGKDVRIALLGATGLTGRAFLRHLAQSGTGWRVTALVRGEPAGGRLPHVDYVAGSLPDRIPAGFPPPDTTVLVHLASAKDAADRRLLHAVNVEGTAAVLSRLPAGAAGVIYASSMSVYGQGAQTGVREDAPTRPATALAASRLAAEDLVTAETHRRGIGAYLLRPRFFVGRGDTSFLPGIRRLGALPVRVPAATAHSVIDVDDYAAVLVRLVQRIIDRAADGRPVRRALHVAYRRPVTVAELTRLAGPTGTGPAAILPARAVIALCRLLPGTTPLRLRTQLELIARPHWADVSALEAEIGPGITGRDPAVVIAAGLAESRPHPAGDRA